MSVGGVGGPQGPFTPRESEGPSEAGKPFQLPSNWQSQLNEVMDLINPDNPQDVERALNTLTRVAEDERTPPSVQTAAHHAIAQLQQGYMTSKNPIELVEPYLTIAGVSMPLGPGRAPPV